MSLAAAFGLLHLLPDAAPLRAADVWPEERSAGPFLCHADFSLKPHAGLIEEISILQRDLTSILGIEEPKENVHLFLFEKKETYQAYMKQYFPRVPARRALYVKGRGPGMVFAFQGADFEIDVRHESTHALLHTSFETVPLWLDEGLAEYFEVPREKRAGENPHLETIRALLRLGQTPRLEALEKFQDLSEMGRDEYRDAWAWVHFMLHGPRAAHEELVGFLKDAQTKAAVPSLSERLRRRIPNLEARLVEHFRP